MARANKAKVPRAEQSAAKDALKVVAAQAKADAAAERKAAADALKPRVDVPTEKKGYHCSMRRRGYRRLL